MYSKLFVYRVFVIEMLFSMYVRNTCYERDLSNVFEVFETSAKVPKSL